MWNNDQSMRYEIYYYINEFSLEFEIDYNDPSLPLNDKQKWKKNPYERI